MYGWTCGMLKRVPWEQPTEHRIYNPKYIAYIELERHKENYNK